MAGKTNAPVKLPSSTNFWDVLKWIVICSFLIVIIIIILANVLPVQKNSPATPSSVQKNSPATQTVNSCKITCSGKDLDAANDYFKTTEWGDIYTFTANYGVVVDENTCDINYTYIPKDKELSKYNYTDYRRFRYSPGCNKKVTGFGSQHSGVTAASPKPSS